MQSNGIIFTSYEQEIVQDRAFLLAKRELTAKMERLWEQLALDLSQAGLPLIKLSARLGIRFQSSKVSKGENYRDLPYVVLDYLRFFDKQGTFTYRCMFWWGNFYSYTLHIDGALWQKLRDKWPLSPDLLTEETYLATGDSAWEYHYEPDNYTLITKDNISALQASLAASPFLKLSRKIDIQSPPDTVLQEGLKNYKVFMQALVG